MTSTHTGGVMSIGIRNEYEPRFGREVLTLWSGSFYSVWEGEAWELPRRDGYMVTTYNGDKVRVACPTPRTDDNYREVDAAIVAAVEALYASNGSVVLVAS